MVDKTYWAELLMDLNEENLIIKGARLRRKSLVDFIGATDPVIRLHEEITALVEAGGNFALRPAHVCRAALDDSVYLASGVANIFIDVILGFRDPKATEYLVNAAGVSHLVHLGYARWREGNASSITSRGFFVARMAIALADKYGPDMDVNADLDLLDMHEILKGYTS